MKHVLVIGIGAGGADLLTVQAIDALNRADVIFTFDKGPEKDDLVQLRKEVCDRYRDGRPYRLVEVPSPKRDASGPYKAGVAAWHEEKAAIFKSLIRDEIADEGYGAFLVWGDPAYYDSTLRILDAVASDAEVEFAYQVIPGISSIQLLAARHRIPLNTIGEPVLLTTGRKLAAGIPAEPDSIVVLLDGGAGLDAIEKEDLEIFWGAYLGTKDEVLVRGRVVDVIDEIRLIRQQCKVRKGWIMDAYLLRRGRSG